MSLLGELLHRIFPPSHPAGRDEPSALPQPIAPGTAAPVASEALAPSIDVGAVLTAMQGRGRFLDWRRSIVDLMTLVGMDSDIASRRALASELQYGGDPDDPAAMDAWLHEQVMRRIAAGGGRVQSELPD